MNDDNWRSSLDSWKTTLPDNDPEWDHQDEQRCPECGAGPDDPCEPACDCRYCRALERAENRRQRPVPLGVWVDDE